MKRQKYFMIEKECKMKNTNSNDIMKEGKKIGEERQNVKCGGKRMNSENDG